ncbi:MAG: type II secretion system protein [Patescibacteria group bacterium]
MKKTKNQKPKTKNQKANNFFGFKFWFLSFKQRPGGFTLIEAIIYLGIVSIILVSISYLMLDILAGQTKNYGTQEVSQNLRFISNNLIRDIESAQDITSLSSDTLVLVKGGQSLTYSFDLVNDNLTRQLGAGQPEILNSNRLEVTGSFSDLSYLGRTKNVGVSLFLNYKNPGNLPDYNASTTFNFSVELKGRR